jgi:hypothetical protein
MDIRHRVAFLIRLRQEAQKRLSLGAAPQSEPSVETLDDLVPAPGVSGFGSLPLAEHLAGLDRASYAEGDQLEAELLRIRAGRLRFFAEETAPENDPPVWRAHPRSGVLSPLQPWHRLAYLHGECGGDVKDIWEVNRHADLLRLAQSWYLKQNGDDAAQLGVLLDSWMEQNPPGWGINWASTLEVGFRVIAWTWITALTHDAPIWTPPRRGRFVWQLWKHGEHIERYDSVHHSPNTHLSGEGLALLYIGCAFPDWCRSTRRRRFGLDILETEARRQLLPDGMHFERATCYHRYTVEFLLHALFLLRLGGRDAEAGAVRRAAAAALPPLAMLRRPDGSVPVLGDEDGGCAVPLSLGDPRDPAQLLVLAKGLSGTPIPKADQSARLAWWLLAATEQTAVGEHQETGPAPRAFQLPQAGYFVAREAIAEDGWFCLVDGGPHGGQLTGHAHDDCGHIEVAHGALRLVTDPGSYRYTSDPVRRAWDRSAYAHATLALESRALAVPRGAFGWRLVPPDPVAQAEDFDTHWVCRVHRRMGREPDAPRHERHVVLLRGYGVILSDWLVGAQDEPFRLTWPTPIPMTKLRHGSHQVDLAGGIVLSWDCAGVHNSTADLMPHPYAPSYGRNANGGALRVRGTCQAVTMIATVFTHCTAPRPVITWEGDQVQVACGSALLEFRSGRNPGIQWKTPMSTSTSI